MSAQSNIGPFDVDFDRDDADVEMAYLDVNNLDEDGARLYVRRRDLERPEIAISLVEAAMYLDPDVLIDVLRARIGLRDFFTFRGSDCPSGLTREQADAWTNWCVAVRVVTIHGEIRESCWDADAHEWTSPWFDLDTGIVNRD